MDSTSLSKQTLESNLSMSAFKHASFHHLLHISLITLFLLPPGHQPLHVTSKIPPFLFHSAFSLCAYLSPLFTGLAFKTMC